MTKKMISGGVVMRKLEPSDIPAALELSAQAGWNQTAEDWRTLVDLSVKGCLGIEVDGELASTTTLLCYGTRLAWIGMVLTRTRYRGRGFARRLLMQALRLADEMHIETVKLDATEQGQPLYEHNFGELDFDMPGLFRSLCRWIFAGRWHNSFES